MVCCSLGQDTRCLCHFLLGRVSSSDLGVKGEGRQEKGLLPWCCLPLTPIWGQKGSVSPSLRPAQGLDTVWPLSPGPGSHLGLSPCNWCQGKRETAFEEAGLARWDRGTLEEQHPSGAAGVGRQTPSRAFPPAQVSPYSSQPTFHHFLLGTHQPAQHFLPVPESGWHRSKEEPGWEETDTCQEATVRPARRGWTPGESTYRATILIPHHPGEDNAAPRGELTC